MKWEIVKGQYQITFGYDAQLVIDLKTSVQGRRWNPDLVCWTAPVTPRNRFLADLYSGKNPYAIYDKEIDMISFKKEHEPGIKKLCPKLDLRPAQWEMLALLMIRRRCVNGAWMRMGKTLPAFFALIILGIRGAWFITTVSAMTGIKAEMAKWGINPDIYLMTYPRFTDLVNESPHLIPQCVILDEGQAIKTVTSNRGKAARACTEYQLENYKESYFWLLSGTPDPNQPIDWFNVIEATCPGYLYEKSLDDFKMTLGYYERQEGQYGGQYLQINKKIGLNGWKVGELKRLGQRLNGLVQIFHPRDYNGPKEPKHEVIKLNVPRGTKSAIKILKASTDGLKFQQMYRQISDGFVYEKGEIDTATLKQEKTTNWLGSAKYDQFKQDLDLFEDIGRLLVYAYYTETVERLTEIAVEKGWVVFQTSGKGDKCIGGNYTIPYMMQSMDYATNDKQIPKLIGINQTDTGNTGREYSACDTTIYVSYPVKSDSYEQGCARMSSGASPNPKMIRHYSYLGIDDLMRESLINKRDIQEIPKKILIEAMQKDIDSDVTEDIIPMDLEEMRT